MAQTNMYVRIDEDVKKDAEAVLDQLGLSMSAAVNALARQIIMTGSIPFELKIRKEQTEES